MTEFFGHFDQVPFVAGKAVLMFLLAVIGFRVMTRRTIAQLAPFDVVTVIASGAIIGRTATSASTSFAEGGTALVVLLLMHGLVTRLRRYERASGVLDHQPRLLVIHGEVQEEQLRKAGLTDDDLAAMLREHGLTRLRDCAYAVFETKGQLSVVHSGDNLAPGEGLLPAERG